LPRALAERSSQAVLGKFPSLGALLGAFESTTTGQKGAATVVLPSRGFAKKTAGVRSSRAAATSGVARTRAPAATAQNPCAVPAVGLARMPVQSRAAEPVRGPSLAAASTLVSQLTELLKETCPEMLEGDLKAIVEGGQMDALPSFVRLFQVLESGLSRQVFVGKLAEIAQDIVNCPSVRYFYQRLSSGTATAAELAMLLPKAIEDAPKALALEALVDQLLAHGQELANNAPLNLAMCREFIKEADARRVNAPEIVTKSSQELQRFFPPSTEDSIHDDVTLLRAHMLWRMLRSNASGEANLARPAKPFRVTRLCHPGMRNDSVIKITLNEGYSWLADPREYSQQDLLDRRSLFLRERELPAVINAFVYALSPYASPKLNCLALAGARGIGQSNLVNVLLLLCAVFDRHLYTMRAIGASEISSMVFVSDAPANGCGWISVAGDYQNLRNRPNPLELVTWFDVRDSSQDPKEMHEPLRGFRWGNIWSLSPPQAMALEGSEMQSHWLDEWQVRELELLVPFVKDQVVQESLKKHLTAIYATVGGSLRSVFEAASNAGTDTSALGTILRRKLTSSLMTALNLEPDSIFVHQRPVQGDETIGRHLRPLKHVLNLDFQRRSKWQSEFRTAAHAAILLDKAQPDEVLQLLNPTEEGADAEADFVRFVLNAVKAPQVLVLTRAGADFVGAGELSVERKLADAAEVLRNSARVNVPTAKFSDVVCLPLGAVNICPDIRAASSTGAYQAGDGKETFNADFLSQVFDTYSQADHPVLFLAPEDASQLGRDAALYIPPKRNNWITAIVSKASASGGQPRVKFNEALGALIMLHFRSDTSISHEDVTEHTEAVKELSNKIAQLRRKAKKPTIKANVFGLVVLAAKSDTLMDLDVALKELIDIGEVAVVDEYAAFAAYLFSQSKLLRDESDSSAPAAAVVNPGAPRPPQHQIPYLKTAPNVVVSPTPRQTRSQVQFQYPLPEPRSVTAGPTEEVVPPGGAVSQQSVVGFGGGYAAPAAPVGASDPRGDAPVGVARPTEPGQQFVTGQIKDSVFSGMYTVAEPVTLMDSYEPVASMAADSQALVQEINGNHVREITDKPIESSSYDSVGFAAGLIATSVDDSFAQVSEAETLHCVVEKQQEEQQEQEQDLEQESQLQQEVEFFTTMTTASTASVPVDFLADLPVNPPADLPVDPPADLTKSVSDEYPAEYYYSSTQSVLAAPSSGFLNETRCVSNSTDVFGR